MSRHVILRSVALCAAPVGALLASAVAARAPAAQGATPRFEIPDAAERKLWRARRAAREIESLELAAGLPGLSEALRIPFANAPRRLRVLAAPRARTTIVAVGGVRTDLTLLVLREGRRCTIECDGGRWLAGFERPWLDDTGDALVLLFRDAQGVQLRAFSVRHVRPRPLLARRLARAPDALSVQVVDGDPRVQLDVGNVAAFAPGALRATEDAGEKLRFLHPRARLPRPKRIAIDFGALAPGVPGRETLELENPGELAMRLTLRPRVEDGSTLRVSPRSVDLPAGGTARAELEFLAATDREEALARVEFVGVLKGAELLGDCVLRARRAAEVDTSAPRLDTSKVETTLLAGRRARILAVSGALIDESGPCKVSHISGASVEVGPDGAFALEIPLGVDGRVRIRARDARGNVSEPFDLGVLRDTSPPRVDKARISLGLLTRGRVLLRGSAGAISDDTPPLRVRARVEPGAREVSILVAADGSFAQAIPAEAGASISVEAQDGAAPLNRGRKITIGRVLPYLVPLARGSRLHAPPFAKLRLTCLGEHAPGEAPPELRSLVGEIAADGTLRLDREVLTGAARVRVRLELLSGRVLTALLGAR